MSKRPKILLCCFAGIAWHQDAWATTKVGPPDESQWTGVVGFILTVVIFAALVWWIYRPRKPHSAIVGFASFVHLPRMTNPAFTTVRSARTQAEAGLLISVLQQASLHPLELGTYGHWSLAGVDIDYSVQVPSDEAEEARNVLNAFDNNAA